MRTFIRQTSAVGLAALALGFIAPGSAQAQAQYGAGPRWLGWQGCWTAAPSGQVIENSADAPRIVCITPTRDPDVVDIAAIAEGKVVTRDRIDASGRTQPIEGTSCKGTQTARWSGDGRRVFLKSSVKCDGVQTEMSAILAMTAGGNWLDVRRVTAGEGTDVRVARYRDVGIPRDVPTEVASLLDTRGNFIAQDARAENGAPVGANAIIEASRLVDASVVEAWIFESGQRYAVDARALTQLADAGVPARVTDAMVSVEKEAQLANRTERDVYYYSPYGWNTYGHYGRGSADAWNQGTTSRTTTDYYEGGRSRFVVNVYTTYDPWGFGYWPYGGYRYGYAPFGYGFRYGRGELFGFDYVNPYGSYWGRSYPYLNNPHNRVGYTYPPTIVLHNDGSNTAPHGRSVKGEGYTPATPGSRPSNEDPRQARPRTERPATERAAEAVVEAARTAAGDRSARPRTESRPEQRAESRPEQRTESRPEPQRSAGGERSASPRTARARP
jgi:hypothetical protein